MRHALVLFVLGLGLIVGCGDDSPDLSPQTCSTANDHISSCGGDGTTFPEGSCDDEPTECGAQCVIDGSCPDVLAFLDGNNNNSVGTCVANCSK